MSIIQGIKNYINQHPYYFTLQVAAGVVLFGTLGILFVSINNGTYDPNGVLSGILLGLIPFYAASVKIYKPVAQTNAAGNLVIGKQVQKAGLIMIVVGLILAFLWILYVVTLQDIDYRESLYSIAFEIIIASFAGLGINVATTQ